MEHCDILIIGAGAAGIAAAKAARDADVLLVDHGPAPGGILRQCAHRGFGHQLTGPEYAARLMADFPASVRLMTETAVLSVSPQRTAILSGKSCAMTQVSFSQLILSAGCREIPIGALPIAGTRPAGIYNAGQMQAMMNLHGFRPDGPVVILGSGDLGLIMAGQIAPLGLSVTLVEQRDRCGGLARNRRCLEEYPIRLLCGDTIAEIQGDGHITGCLTANGQLLPCRTLLIAAGLRPERELVSCLGSPDWLRLCGNCSTVHTVVDSVVNEGTQAGLAALQRVRGTL